MALIAVALLTDGARRVQLVVAKAVAPATSPPTPTTPVADPRAGGTARVLLGAAADCRPRPGTLIKSEKVAVAGLHGTVYRVMYVSETVDDKPVAVTG